MSRKVKQHPVELLVTAYVKPLGKTNNMRSKQAVMLKASKMIGIALHNPCCAPAEEVILGNKEDYFLVQLTALLNGIDGKRKWKASLERAKAILDNLLTKPCCFNPSNNWAFVTNGTGGTMTISSNEVDFVDVDAAATGNYNWPIGQTIVVSLTNDLSGFCLAFGCRIEVIVRNAEGEIVSTIGDENFSTSLTFEFITSPGMFYQITGTVHCEGS